MWSFQPTFSAGSKEQRHFLCPEDWHLLAEIRHFLWPWAPVLQYGGGGGEMPACRCVFFQDRERCCNVYTLRTERQAEACSDIYQAFRVLPLFSVNGQCRDLLPLPLLNPFLSFPPALPLSLAESILGSSQSDFWSGMKGFLSVERGSFHTELSLMGRSPPSRFRT